VGPHGSGGSGVPHSRWHYVRPCVSNMRVWLCCCVRSCVCFVCAHSSHSVQPSVHHLVLKSGAAAAAACVYLAPARPCNLLVCAWSVPSLATPADKPYTEAHGYSAIPPASPASFRRQQQLQHMRQQRQQHNMEREERCLAGDAAAAAAADGGAKPKGTKAQNAQQQARLKHNQGVKASANVRDRMGGSMEKATCHVPCPRCLGGRQMRACLGQQQAVSVDVCFRALLHILTSTAPC
jgi:hypothetical protein